MRPIERRLKELAQLHADDAELGEDEYDAAVEDLRLEFYAAISDRWLDWRKARKAGLPFGHFVEG